MAWQTPKTDWHGSINEEGIYEGDYFNVNDFNRIKNNLEYLRELAVTMYEKFDILYIGEDKTVSDYFYAEEINEIEENLAIINENTLRRFYGLPPNYFANGKIMDSNELNRLENATLDLYMLLTGQAENRRMFTWNFGIKGGL